MLNRIIAAVLGLLIPGWGHAYYQRYRQALLFQGLLLLIIGLICWSRWITDFSGGVALLLFALVIHVVSSITATSLTYRTTLCSKWRKIIALTIFPALAISAVLTVLRVKSSLLGIDLYQISSQSMLPTLKPGDIVLIDNWAYKHKTPTIGDIVVFSRKEREEKEYVKRVHPIPDKIKNYSSNDGLYLLGDNRNSSMDSRYYGLIDRNLVTGRVCYILNHRGSHL